MMGNHSSGRGKLEGVKMSPQDLLNSSSFALQHCVEKIISNNITKVSTTNCM